MVAGEEAACPLSSYMIGSIYQSAWLVTETILWIWRSDRHPIGVKPSWWASLVRYYSLHHQELLVLPFFL